ncbi:glycosyltransferase [Pedobacter psychrodurus]|uniref:glycosyltransferase n=1 Tax=Pedobacter psychrodurus TaxID=2530456 RepID=UPI00293018FA|nr:glycosyltransferase [Pedobacter psychrodurus]
MRILHITAYITGGAGIAVMRLHQALLEHGIDSEVLCMHALDENLSSGVYRAEQKKPFIDRVFKKLGLDRNTRIKGGRKGKYEIFSFPFSHYRLEHDPRVKRADLVHLHWISDFVDLPSFFKAVKKPMVWTAHDLNPILGGFHYEQDVVRNINFQEAEDLLRIKKHDSILSAGVRFIASSTQTLQKVKHYLPDVKCNLIPCILDIAGFRPIDKGTARGVLNISGDSLILGTGADDLENYRKGYWLLLEAMGELEPDEKKAITILTFGAIKANVNGDTERNTNVIRFEPVHDKRFHSLLYSAMDIFINPSLEETFGLTGTEAILCGTPLIASATGGMIDYLEPGVSGYLFNPGDAVELRKLIRAAIKSKKEKAVILENCRESILEWYKLNDPLGRHIDLYREMLT